MARHISEDVRRRRKMQLCLSYWYCPTIMQLLQSPRSEVKEERRGGRGLAAAAVAHPHVGVDCAVHELSI